MNILLFIVFLTVAGNPYVTCVFDDMNQSPMIEYVVEEKQPNGTWVEVAVAQNGPITYVSKTLQPTYSCRVYARNKIPMAQKIGLSNEMVSMEYGYPIIKKVGIKL